MGARGRKSRAELSIVSGGKPQAPAVVKPPRKLGEHGAALWKSITVEYHIDSAGVVEQLAQACQALDRAEACAAQIAKDGVMFEDRDHPLIKHELAARAFVNRTLQRLGLES